ncbi:MAG: gluconate 2-dehydrogenase subunit 3 family protein [Acidobacteria bacterium]|nr:gluconate 2-dehydrogenase subunit 3 family protein [Acidobacteriota bacterium]
MADGDRRDPRLDRRDVLKIAAASAAITSTLGVRRVLSAGQAASPRFFTTSEYSLVDELAEEIIPTDSHSPGARAARVAAYIDGELADAWTAEERNEWRDGLAAIDDLSRRTSGKTFLEATPAERVALLTAIASKEASPESAAEKFFVTLKSRVAFAYYTSEIGIHREMEYQGNVYLQEFVGYDVRTEK